MWRKTKKRSPLARFEETLIRARTSDDRGFFSRHYNYTETVKDNKTSVHFVSLGPGGADTVTLGTLRLLMEADKVYCFASGGVSHAADTIAALFAMEAGGDLTENRQARWQSIELGQERWQSAEIGQERWHAPEVITVEVPMSRDRSAVNAIYNQLAEEIHGLAEAGFNVCVATEGDSGVFATTHYVQDRLTDAIHGCMGNCGDSLSGGDGGVLRVEQHPGVPSFIAAASIAGLHLVKLQERLVVIPGETTAEELTSLLRSNYNIVVMKLSLATEAIRGLLTASQRDIEVEDVHGEASEQNEQPLRLSLHYFRNIGMPTQEYRRITSAEEVPERFPYFSLMIIQRGE